MRITRTEEEHIIKDYNLGKGYADHEQGTGENI